MAQVLPVVSVVVINYRGTEDTLACLRALRETVDYPAELLQVVCVDNASGGDAVARLRTVAGVEVVVSATNLGFAGGCNLGASRATGSVLAFLNNDARPDPAWVRAAVEVLRAQPGVGAVASKVLDLAGERIDFVDGGLTWFGMGYKRHVGELDTGAHDTPTDVLFGTGSAMFVRAGVFAALGGFDERYFMFYEDVDLGWRLNLRGWRFRYEPRSIAYHRHHGTMSTVDGEDQARELYLLERNALATLYKNVSDETLARALPAALALAVRRATARGEVDTTALELSRGTGELAPTSTPPSTLAGVYAIDQFVELLPSLRESRAVEQAARRRSDADIAALTRRALEPAYPHPRYLWAHDVLVDVFGLDEVFSPPRKVLVLTADAIAERMAGPAIRAWHMAEVLTGEHDVRLVTVNPRCVPPPAPFEIARANRAELKAQVDWADVVVLQGHVLEHVPSLKDLTTRQLVVCDLYDPMHLELLEQGRDLATGDTEEQRALELAGVTSVLTAQLRRGDLLLCASERQRHLWLGHLAAIGRLSPALYDADPTLRSLLDVAPFGLSGKPPQQSASPLRDGVAGIGPGDKIVLWGGGVYSWFDPLTLLRAVDRAARTHPDLRLVFLGMKHPNPQVPDMDIAGETRSLAEQLGLTGRHVFFNETWVPYAERQNWLLDANCGVSTHFEHVETTFAFRTRILDYLWAGLPIVTTDGDTFAELVRAEGLGVVVPAEDPAALADALVRVLYDAEFAASCVERIAVVRERFTWDATLAPLVEFCRAPRPAVDRLAGAAPLTSNRPLRLRERLGKDVALVREYLGDGGPAELARRVVGRVRRLAKGGGGR